MLRIPLRNPSTSNSGFRRMSRFRTKRASTKRSSCIANVLAIQANRPNELLAHGTLIKIAWSSRRSPEEKDTMADLSAPSSNHLSGRNVYTFVSAVIILGILVPHQRVWTKIFLACLLSVSCQSNDRTWGNADVINDDTFGWDDPRKEEWRPESERL